MTATLSPTSASLAAAVLMLVVGGTGAALAEPAPDSENGRYA
jgi:hypothetical protein